MVSLAATLTPLRIILKPRSSTCSVAAARTGCTVARRATELRAAGRATPRLAPVVKAVACILGASLCVSEKGTTSWTNRCTLNGVGGTRIGWVTS